MAADRIEELMKKRPIKEGKRKDQVKYGVILSLLGFVVFGCFMHHNKIFGILWIIGLFIGFTLQRSRFCFTASFRDPIMVGSTSLFKAVLVAFAISTIGFGLIQYHYIHQFGFHLENIPGQIKPVGLHTILGAILFGMGMVIAGGCASGTLMRIGEGFLLQIVVLGSFIIGSVLGASHFEFWDRLIISKSPKIYLPQYLGLPATMILQVIVFMILYMLADWYDRNNSMMSL